MIKIGENKKITTRNVEAAVHGETGAVMHAPDPQAREQPAPPRPRAAEREKPAAPHVAVGVFG